MKNPEEWMGHASILLRTHWVWVGVGLILVTVGVRYLLLSDAIRSARILGKDFYKEALSRYRTRSLKGWIFIGASFVLAETVLCVGSQWPAFLDRRDGIWLSILLYLVGVLCHARVFHSAAFDTLKKRIEP